MADSPAFTALCEALEEATSLDRLEARGTVRLALKQAGLEAHSVSASQLGVVIERVLPEELRTRGVDDSVCPSLASTMASISDGGGVESPEAVFSRLGS